MLNDILNKAKTVMMPKSDHTVGSDTHGKGNTQDKMVNDGKDLNKAKNKDAKKMKEHIQEERKKNESQKDPKKKKERDDCLDAMEKTLDSKEFAEYNPKDLVDEILGEYDDNIRSNTFKNGKTKLCAELVE